MRSFPSSLGYPSLLIALSLILLLVASGCTQQAAPTPETVNGLQVSKPDTSHIMIAFVGAQGMDGLMELEITITDSNGKSLTMSKGSRLGTTPLPIHATETFTGSYSGKNHVFVTGYFSDGTHRALIDRDI
jgi:hypothetical protein